MSNRLRSAMAAAGYGGEKIYIEDVFSTYLYTGNNSTQTINNGIDLAGKGGLVWLKIRSNPGYYPDHYLIDTERGGTQQLFSNNTNAQSTGNANISFSSSGFNLLQSGNNSNGSGQTYASWTFRKAPKFFDVVTYTGNGVAGRQISHSLGSVPGMMIVKQTNKSGANWAVYHRSLGATKWLQLNATAASEVWSGPWNNTEPTATEFTLGGTATINESGYTFVAYLFAHDAGGFGESGTDNVISCGSFTTDGSGNATVNLGWEPQYILVKPSSGTGGWHIADVMRGASQTVFASLVPNTSAAENPSTGSPYLCPTATGFTTTWYWASTTLIYMAIRRGPMRTPTSGTSVFIPVTQNLTTTPTITTNFVVDTSIVNARSGGSHFVNDRLRGGGSSSYAYLRTDASNAESTGTGGSVFSFDSNTSVGKVNTLYPYTDSISWNFRRAPGFFDVVCYTNSVYGSAISHSLGVVPELIIRKNRQSVGSWFVGHKNLGWAGGPVLDANASGSYWSGGFFANQSPTSTVFYSNAASDQITYLFASCPGVSKVGSYTGNGSSQTINCGFTAGARFVLIKCTSTTGDWYVWDTARGIVSANDPHLSLNSTAAEVTTDDSIDPDSTGFIVNQVAATNINVNGASYIYLAIS